MINRLFKILSSLRLTVVLLSFALLLVFFGTLAQVKLGLYDAQAEYFRSLFVFWKPQGASFKIPIFPGGWLLGGLLLVNLLAAHAKRFQFAWKKSGIFLIHIGLILLLLGQFLTELFQIESVMRLDLNQTKNYTEDSRHNELAIIDVSKPDKDDVVSIPESLFKKKGEIHVPGLPFTINVKSYFENSTLAGPMTGEKVKMHSSQGIGQKLSFAETNATKSMDDENKPAAWIEIVGEKGPIGDWLTSLWLTKYGAFVKQQTGDMLGNELDEPQLFTANGHTYQIALRPIRYYKPYRITLLKATHEIYPGTGVPGIPKNFSSKIHLSDPARGEERDVLIYMNNPFRYAGETFFQFQMDAGAGSSTLQVVKNPAAITPYLSCTLVGLGLLTQFLMHLINFGRKNKNQTPTSRRSETAKKEKPSLTPAAVAQRRVS
jgi:hypothetical protein